MTAWTTDELSATGAAEELEFAPLRSNGTLHNPVTIWVIRHGDDLYIRCYKGDSGAWFRAAQARHSGCIWAGGIEKHVTFVEESDPDLNDRIDATYRTKYRRYASYVSPMIRPESRATTLKLVPHSTRTSFIGGRCPDNLEGLTHC